MSENPLAVKGINKLEAIGKKGKLTKILKVTIEQFEFLKQSMNGLSLKILAYVIKGFFLNIKKSYENFSKDLETFIEINIKGMKPRKVKKESYAKEKPKDAENIFSMQNLSLFSENTQFERFLADTNMTDKINKTLKKISMNFFLINFFKKDKQFSSIDFSSMTEEKKKEYLKKNFVQPLSDSLPLSCDYFMNSNIDQCISINENFANYINFDLKSITQDYIVKKQTQSQSQHLNNLAIENEFNFSQREFDFELVDIKQNMSLRNPLFKVDPKIEFSIQRYCDEVEQIYSKDISFKNAHLIYQKNYKKIILHDQLQKFKLKNSDKENEGNYWRKLNNMLLIDDFSDFSLESTFEGLSMRKNLKEKFRNDSEFTPGKNSKMSKVMSELMTSTSIKNVFEDNYSSQHQIQNMQEDLDLKNNKDDKIFASEGNSFTRINKNDESFLLGKEQYQMINKELQENIEKVLASKGNFQEFKLDQVTKEISINFANFSQIRNKLPSLRAECSLVFYNMLMVSQTENFYLKQSAPFGKLYIVKI